jgi:aconitate hydratase
MNSFGSRSVFRAGQREFEISRLDVLEKQGLAVGHLPFSLRILLENLLRREDGKTVKADDIRALTSWTKKSHPSQEIAFMPSRVLLQDFTGVPAVVDLAAMRDAMKALGGDPTLINPLQPAEPLGPDRVQELRHRSAGYRHSPPDQP